MATTLSLYCNNIGVDFSMSKDKYILLKRSINIQFFIKILLVGMFLARKNAGK